MPDVDAALDEMRHFADHPPHGPAPIEELVERATRRRRRRRGVSGLVGTTVLVAVTAVSVAVVVDDEGARVRAVAPGPGTSEAEPEPGAGEFRVEPATSLREGQTVIVTGPFDPDELVGVGQCASEAKDAEDPVPWCDINVGWLNQPEDEDGIAINVVRMIETSNGLFDCAERPERCLIGVRTPAGDLLAPISFDPTLGPLPVPAVEVDRPAVEDGEAFTVSGSGFQPRTEVFISQCVGEATNGGLDEEQLATTCDQARGARILTDGDGRFEAHLLAYADILDYDGWRTCDPCVLSARATRHTPAVTPLQVAATGAAVRPTVSILQAPPFDPGERVTLAGANFQAGGGDMGIGWCSFRTATPETEIQGDPRSGYTPCAYPNEGFSIEVDQSGAFRVEGFPLPGTAAGWVDSADCQAPGVRCGLAWHPMEGSPPAFVTLFDLRQ